MKERKPETVIRDLKRESARTKAAWHAALQDKDKAQDVASEYRGRAGRAEAEVAEWKRRFDELLSRCQIVTPPKVEP